MPTETEPGGVCPRCGGKLPPGPAPTCPACGSTHSPGRPGPTDATVAVARDGRPDGREAGSRDAPTVVTRPHAGHAPPSGAPPRRFSRYTILGEIGRGGMGVVYRCYDPKLKRVVALKVLIAGENASPEDVERFFREAEAAAKLRHPNIVPIHELDVCEGRHYFTMDFIEGTPLDGLLAGGALPPRRAVELAEKIARAVHAAHALGIVHRDLKPSNVVVTPGGEPMVMDFGLARETKCPRRVTRTGVFMGTPEYTSPEQATGRRDADARSDVFSMGAVLYEMLAGRPPFGGSGAYETLNAVVKEDPRPPHSLVPSVPRDAEAVCMKCLEKDPARRYQSAEALADDCRRFLGGEPVKARPPSPAYRLRRRLARHGAAVAGAAIALAGVAGVGVWATVALSGKAREIERTEAERARRLRASEPYTKAMSLLVRGLAREALPLLDEAVRADPGFAEAHFARGEALRATGCPLDAAGAYVRASGLAESATGRPNLQSLIAAGFAYDNAGMYAESEGAFQKADECGADDALALVGRAFRMGHRGRYSSALSCAEEALAKGAGLWETHLAVGYALVEAAQAGAIPRPGSYERAVAELRKALEMSPAQAEACVWLAWALGAAGGAASREEAARLFDRTVELEPGNPNRYILRATNDLKTGDLAGADRDLARALELGAPEKLVSFFLARRAYAECLSASDAGLARARAEEAFGHMTDAVRSGAQWPPNLANWFIMAVNVGRFEEVRGAFDRWYAENPEFHYVYLLKGQLFAREGKWAEAAAECRKAAALVPYNLQLVRALPEYRARAGDWEGSLEAAGKGLADFPGDSALEALKAAAEAHVKRDGF